MTAWSQLLPAATELVPWTDRRGRFDTLRAVVLALLIAPGAWLFGRWSLGVLGADPVSKAIHSTGYWAVWILVASLTITPLKALSGSPNVVVVRRMMGNAALVYALIHIGLYATDHDWKLWTIGSEIVKRFYLTLGAVALLGLLALGLTSTDGWVRHLGKTWKQLHRVVYALAVLALFHYVLQSKLDVSKALLATGVFTWLMLWRALPAGRDRSWPWLLLITLGAAVATAIFEYGWYWLGTKVDPAKVLRLELQVAYGLHPVGQVLVLGLLATTLLLLRRMTDTAWGAGPAPTMLVYALGGLAGAAMPWFFAWIGGEVAMDEPLPWLRAPVWIGLLAGLGAVRWCLAATWQRRLVDAALLACIAYDVLRLTTDDPRVVTWGAAALVVGAAVLMLRLWSTERRIVLALLPLAALLAYQAAVV